MNSMNNYVNQGGQCEKQLFMRLLRISNLRQSDGLILFITGRWVNIRFENCWRQFMEGCEEHSLQDAKKTTWKELHICVQLNNCMSIVYPPS